MLIDARLCSTRRCTRRTSTPRSEWRARGAGNLRAAGVEHSADYDAARRFDPQATPRVPRPAPAREPEPEGPASLVLDRIRLKDLGAAVARLKDLGATATRVSHQGSTGTVRAWGLSRAAVRTAGQEM